MNGDKDNEVVRRDDFYHITTSVHMAWTPRDLAAPDWESTREGMLKAAGRVAQDNLRSALDKAKL